MSILRKITPLTIALLYCLIGAIWIFLSNTFFEVYHIQGKPHALIETSQEVIFIFISGTLLYFLLRKYSRQIEKSTKELKDNERLYRTLLENGEEIIGLTDKEGNIKYIGNDSTFSLLGYSKEELMNTSIFQFLHPDDLEKGNAVHQQVISSPGVLITVEFRILHKSGNYIWIEAKAVNRLNDPDIAGTVLNVKVINERKLAEEKIKAEESKNKAILATLPDLYFIINDEGRYVYSIDADSFFFTSKGEFEGKTIFEVLPPELANKAWYYINQAFKTNELQIFDHQATINNKVNCIESRIKKLSSKEVLVIVRNVTEKYESELKLKESEAMFRSTFEQAAVGIAHVSFNLNRIRINNKFCEILGRTKEEIFNLPINEISHPEDFEKEQVLLQQLINNEIENYQIEKRYFRKDGSIIWTNLNVSTVKNENGVPQYFIAVIQDISHKKLMEQELRFKNQELNTFIYRASHDLRGPITSLMGLGRIAKLEIEDKTALEFMDKALVTANKLDEILSSLIDLTKIQQGNVTAQEINFEQKIDEIIANLNADTNINFVKKIEIKDGFYSDISLIRSILQNLIENAIKYSKDDPYFSKKVWIDVCKKENGVQIKVRDNGIGIQQNEQEKIFNMFYRASSKAHGSGLGLYIVKSAVDRLGGKISLYSEEEIGTEFNIFIPESRSFQLI